MYTFNFTSVTLKEIFLIGMIFLCNTSFNLDERKILHNYDI